MWFCCIYYLIFINFWIIYRCTDLRMIYIITSNQPLTFHMIKIGRLWNVVFLCRTRPSTGRKKIISSDKWTRFQLQIFHRARRWRNDSCNRFICHLVHRRCSLIDTWSPKFNASRIRAGVGKRFFLAHRAISLSSIGVVFRRVLYRGCSSTIPVASKRCIRWSITEWCTSISPAIPLLLKPACDMPTACHLSAKVNFRLTII